MQRFTWILVIWLNLNSILVVLRGKWVMANSASAKKRARQAEDHRVQNAGQRSMVRTLIKRVVTTINSKDVNAAKSAYLKAVPIIDKMAGKGILNPNKAARHKKRLNAKLKELATSVG